MKTWLSEHLIFSGDLYYSEVLTAINSARTSVDFETYIFDDDEIGQAFEKAFIDAAKRGVTVRVVVDGFGASHWAERKALSLTAAGVQFRVYHPVRMFRLLTRILFGLGFRRHSAARGRSLLGHINRRNHRKVCIIDQTQVWAGSLNVSAVHSEKKLGALAWRDTAVGVTTEVGSSECLALREAFETVFQKSHRLSPEGRWLRTRRPLRLLPAIEHFALQKSPLVRLNHRLRLRRQNYRELALLVRSAKSRIWITNAYLAPSKPIVRRLKKARERGVDVRILVPRKSDVFFMPWVAGAHYGVLLRSQIRIFEYLPRFLHAKSVIIDDWASVGSSNLNRRSMLKDLEIDIVLSSPQTHLELAEQFNRDLLESEEVTTAPTGFRAFLGRLITAFMKDLI